MRPLSFKQLTFALQVISSSSLLVAAVSNATASANQTQPQPSLNFHLTTGGNENYFLRDNVTSAQLLLTSSNNTSTNGTRRLVVALPAGNNGALAYFLPLGSNSSNTANASQLNVELVNGTLGSTTEAYGNTGLQADLAFSGNATLGITIVGAVRAMRDYVEGSGTMHEIFNYTLAEHSSTSVHLHRRYINTTSPSSSLHPAQYKSVDLYLSIPPSSSARLSVTPGNNGTFSPPQIDVLVPLDNSERMNSTATVRVRVLMNETSLVGLDRESLFLPVEEGSTPGVQQALKALGDGGGAPADQVSFLTYQYKFTAGGWRFLTYFGRDSMIALRFLMPLMTSEAIEAALGAVIERANTTGALCHEETIGDYASFVNIGNNRSDLGNTPFYDYKMIDTDLLLLPALRHYFLELPQGLNRSSAFLAKNATLQNGTYGEILNRISTYNLLRALPFSRSPTQANLLSFRPGEPVGNWRDSNQGTGYGRTPFDVNVALVPASLRAMEGLVRAGVLASPSPSQMQMEVEGKVVDVGKVAAVWEQEAPGLFEVVVHGETALGRLEDFVKEAGLSEALIDANGTGAGGNVSFYALALRDDGSPVEVLNSDLGFNLMYGTNVSARFLERVVDALTPYPRGLLTNIGMVVANPAYDSNRTNVQVLDRTAYHGTVVWSFQQGLMAGGLARQLGFCGPNTTTSVDVNPPPDPKPSWCTDSDLVQRLRDAQARLWESIAGAPDNLYSEVWSYSFDNSTGRFAVADLASLSPEGTESDAIQLWSYGFLGLLDPRVTR